MKKTSLILSLIVVFVLHACNNPVDLKPLTGSATFSFFAKEKGTSGRVSGELTPAFILLSIEDTNGKEIEKDKKLALQAFGQSYVTQDVELAPGNYRLTKFLVLDTTNIVIYASPLEDADLAYYVDDPLPINFSINQNSKAQLSPQVLNVGNDDKPENFGYIGFEFDIVTQQSTVLIKADVKMEIGEILYEDVDANVRVQGYDASSTIQWTKDYNFIGPNYNVLEVKNGFHHYSIEIVDTWGVTDIQSDIGAKIIWDGRSDGPHPVTYVLVGSKDAKKLTSYITSREVDIAGTGKAFQPESRVFYSYKPDSHVESMRYELYNAQTLQFEESFTEKFTYEGKKVSRIVGTLKGKYFKEINYTYGNPDKITEINLNTGITTTVLVTTDDADNNVSAAYSFSNGNSLLYQFQTSYKNMVSDRTAKGNQLCNQGIYTYDKNINPFRHLGYTDILFRNWSANNRLTEHVDHLACAFPQLIPLSFAYTYDHDGYPVQQITSYKSADGESDPISPYRGKIDFYYE